MSVYPAYPREMTRAALYAEMDALEVLPKYIRAGRYEDETTFRWECAKCHDQCTFFSSFEKAERDARAHVILYDSLPEKYVRDARKDILESLKPVDA